MYSKDNLIDFENEYTDYESWYANITPVEIRALKGRQIIYVDYVAPYRGYYSVKTAIIHDAHYSMILIDDGNDSIDKRSIIKAGIRKK